MKKLLLSLMVVVIALSAAIVLPSIASAQGGDLLENLRQTGAAATDLPSERIGVPDAIGRMIQFFLTFLGILALLLFLYSGFLWMTAGGDSAKVDKAKDYMKNAVIGIVIILGAFIIAEFVIEQVQEQLGA